jgi:hypothetical protein
MSDRELEERLASVPTRELPAEGQRQVLEAILAAGERRPAHWWGRRIPLWQAAAVWLVLTTAVVTIGRRADSPHAGGQARPAPIMVGDEGGEPATLFVAVDPTVLGITRKPAYRMDIARWSPMAQQKERKVEP